MGMTRDAAFRLGDTFKVIVSNKPHVDLGIPPESNDYRWAEYAGIKIYNPCDELQVNDCMCGFENRVGWYYYHFPIPLDALTGLWRIEVTLGAHLPKCGIDPCTIPTTASITQPTSSCPTTAMPTTGAGTTGTSGTSGNPYYDLVENKAINYFRVVNLEIL